VFVVVWFIVAIKSATGVAIVRQELCVLLALRMDHVGLFAVSVVVVRDARNRPWLEG
jgi:hypothetical protein